MMKLTSKTTSNLTIGQQTNNKQITTNKNEKNEKNEKNNEEEVIKCYEENIGMITPATVELITDYLKDVDKELIIKAIKIASINNKRSMRYIQGILNDWIRKGIKTVLDAENEEKKFKKQKDAETTADIDYDNLYAN